MAYAGNRDVTFQHPVFFPTVGMDLPAGTYRVEIDRMSVVLHGHQVDQDTDILHVAAGVLAPDDLGFSARLLKGELAKAVAADRAKGGQQ